MEIIPCIRGFLPSAADENSHVDLVRLLVFAETGIAVNPVCAVLNCKV